VLTNTLCTYWLDIIEILLNAWYTLYQEGSWVFSNPGEIIAIQNLPSIFKDAIGLSITYAITEQPAYENRSVAF
jgi:hypothetical protein